MAAVGLVDTVWRRRLAPWGATGATGAAVMALMWLVVQMGVWPAAPGSFVAVWRIAVRELPWLGGWWASAWGLGTMAARGFRLPHRVGVTGRLSLGAAALLAWTWVVLWAVGSMPTSAAVALAPGLVCAVGAGVWAVRGRGGSGGGTAERAGPGWWLLAWAPGVALLLVAAACPPGTLWRVEAFGYDVTSYHLQLPREWLEAGRFEALRHNVYSFLPSGVEATYTLLGMVRGSAFEAVYTCQFWHASMAVLTAAAIAGAARERVGHPAAILGGAAVLVLPWVLITGSLAYNEMAMIALTAGALRVAALRPAPGWGLGAALGLMLGAATLAKLTAGPMLAVPVVLIAAAGPWLTPGGINGGRDDTPTHAARLYRRAAVVMLAATVIGTLVLTPYFARNALATGNPVFPFATDVFGAGHWTDAQAARWEAAHGLDGEDGADRVDAIGRQWLLNSGFGALGGSATPREVRNIARFDREGGVPVLWLAVAAGAAAALASAQTRRLAAAMLGWLLWQVMFWLFATHLQSRFLLPTVLPAGILLGLGAGLAGSWSEARLRLAIPLGAGVVMACLSVASVTTLWEQTRPVASEGRPRPAPVWAVVGSLEHPPPHPLNRLPADARPLLIADNSALLYIRRPLVYSSPFDASPLGEMTRRVGGDPVAVNAAMRQRGITHVWAHWSELRRLHETYGYDPAVTETALRRLARSWRVVEDLGPATLYALPREP